MQNHTSTHLDSSLTVLSFSIQYDDFQCDILFGVTLVYLSVMFVLGDVILLIKSEFSPL